MFGLSLGTMGAGTILGGAGVLPPAPAVNVALNNWRAGGTYGKTALFLGDSLFAPADPYGQITNRASAAYKYQGGQLDNCVLVNAGEIGVTFENVMNGTSVYNINWLLTQNFDLLLVKLGTNSVRTGAATAANISSMLTSLVTQVHTAKPNACIVLWMPNIFLSTDPTSSGYVTPNISFAQQYSDALVNGYNAVVGNWPTFVAHVSSVPTFGSVCQPTSSIMMDVLHPNNAGYDADLASMIGLIQPRGWPFTTLYSTDPFLTETVLGLNGDSLTDYRGKHVVTQSPAGVTASGGWLNLNGTGALKINDVLTDFQFGSWSAGAGDAKVTIELQINSPVVSMPNGQVWFCNNSNLQIGNGSDPNYKMNVSNFGSTELGNATVVTGSVVNYAWEFGQGLYSEYLNGVRQFSPTFANVNFNTAGGSLYLFQEQTGWTAVVARGQARVRVTRECRFNHAPAYTPYPGMWPTT